jgi:hypothetical protein
VDELGVDVFSREVTPQRYRPGIGLRPGGERPEVEAVIVLMSSTRLAEGLGHQPMIGAPFDRMLSIREITGMPLNESEWDTMSHTREHL